MSKAFELFETESVIWDSMGFVVLIKVGRRVGLKAKWMGIIEGGN